MAENDKTPEPAAPTSTATPPAPGAPAVPPRRSPGHRGADVKDTVAEMAAKAHEISLEAGSRMAAAMKDVVNAAAGLSGFVIESARDLVQFMVRRGQMTQEEADKLLRQVEEHQPRRPPTPLKSNTSAHSAAGAKPAHATSHSTAHVPVKHAPAVKTASKAATKPAATKPAAKKPAAKKPAAKKPAAKKPAAKKRAPKPARTSSKARPAPKKAAKPAPKKAAPKKPAPKKTAAKKPAPKKAAKARRK